MPASAAEHFEKVMKEAVPDLFLKHPDLLHLLITMVSPAVLSENKVIYYIYIYIYYHFYFCTLYIYCGMQVPIVRAVQEPGQYVITFPKAYHAGFSHGVFLFIILLIVLCSFVNAYHFLLVHMCRGS